MHFSLLLVPDTPQLKYQTGSWYLGWQVGLRKSGARSRVDKGITSNTYEGKHTTEVVQIFQGQKDELR